MAEGAQAALLIDENGNFVGILQDGSVYRIQTTGKVQNTSGTAVDPATESTLATLATESKLEAVRVLLNSLDGKDFATQTTLAVLAGKDFATQTTLATLATETKLEAVRALLFTIDADTSHLDVDLSTRATEATLLSADGRLTTIDSVLDSIKDTDGIKKITDQLPAGTNEIGKVAQGTKAAAADGWPQVLYDSAGHPVGVVLDDTIYRIQADAKVAKGASALVTLDAIDTTTGQGRLKATLYTPEGEAVAFGSVPPSPAAINNGFVTYSSSSDLRVDGSVTPVEFTFNADSTYDIALQEIKFLLVSNSITFGSGYFGATSGPLSNGVLVEVTDGGTTGTVATLWQNESFVNFASPGGFEWVVSSKDLMSSSYLIGGALKLHAGSADNVKVTIRDNIASCGVYFKCWIKGNLLAAV